jgi:DNA-binding response OmpR family regulator/CBS domain-containing protein
MKRTMTMSGESLRALLVSTDRPLLRRLTWLLESIGCAGDSLADPHRAEALLLASPPDFLIVDTDLPGEWAANLCRQAVEADEEGPPPVVLALVARRDAAQIATAFAAGADDILHKPLVVGEVLARLRTAARLRQQQWHRHIQQGNSETPGCLPAPAWKALASEVAQQANGSGAVVFLSLDYLPIHIQRLTRRGAARLKAAVVERLQAAGGDEAVWGEMDDGCYAALLTSCDEPTALAWAERLRTSVAERPLEVESQVFSVTISLGVAALGAGDAVVEERVRGALQLACRSGRDCVVSATDWEADCKRLVDQPSWLDTANAWDIMLPAPLALYPDDTVEQAAVLLAQTQLGHLPVVDGTGRLVGLLSARSLQPAERRTNPPRGSGSIRYVRAVMHPTPAQFEEDTPARKIASFFAAESAPVAVVTRHGRPLGILYSHTLTSLQESLTPRTFASGKTFSLNSDYLVTSEAYALEET